MSSQIPIVFIAYHFPPRGGAGVQRSVKFSKYLPEFGFEPHVITTEVNGTSSKWTPEDKSLSMEVGARVFRASLGPQISGRRRRFLKLLCLASGNGLQWSGAAIRTGRKVIEECHPKLIYVSMSPFEGALAASRLAKEFGLPWVADLRDPWALDEMQIYPSGFHRAVERKKMRKALSSASLIIMNTPEAASRLLSEFPEFQKKAVTHITNGYDSADYQSPMPPSDPRFFTIVHSGFLHTDAGLELRKKRRSFELLGRVTRGVDFLTRSHCFLVQAIEQWLTEHPELQEKVRLRFVGSQSPADESIINTPLLKRITTFEGYLPHRESVNAIRSANLLFLPMHNLPRGQRATIVPGKTYEYLATGRPILATVPEGDARDFVTHAQSGLISDPTNVEMMVKALKGQYQVWLTHNPIIRWNRDFVEQFERRVLTQRLAAELHRFCGSAALGRDPSALAPGGARKDSLQP